MTETPGRTASENSSSSSAAKGYGSYRMARDEMRMERDKTRYANGKGSAFYAIYWLVVVIAYLAVSYFSHGWNWSWIILAVAGVIFYPIANSQKR